jgi:hypothetical protein
MVWEGKLKGRQPCKSGRNVDAPDRRLTVCDGRDGMNGPGVDGLERKRGNGQDRIPVHDAISTRRNATGGPWQDKRGPKVATSWKDGRRPDKGTPAVGAPGRREPLGTVALPRLGTDGALCAQLIPNSAHEPASTLCSYH